MFWGILCCHIDHALLESSSWYGFTKFLIFQKQPSCPRNICTKHWRKPPIFTAFLGIFLYFLNNGSSNKSFVNCASHLFPRLNKVFSLHLVDLVASNFDFDLVPPLLYKMKSLFFGLWKFAKLFMSFLKTQVSFPLNFPSVFSAIKHKSSVHF